MKNRQKLDSQLHRLWQRKGLLSTLLTPLSFLVGCYTRYKRKRYESDVSQVFYSHTPVIVVGNLIVGGAGKTPVVMALIDELRAAGYTPGVISRGYGVQVGPEARSTKHHHEAAFLGDEPALIHQQKQVPVAVHPKRAEALKALNSDFPEVDVVISDDGLQHLALGRCAEIIVQDQRGIANGRLLPAGPLRETPDRLKHATLIVTQITADQAFEQHASAIGPTPTAQMRLWPSLFRQLQTGNTLPLNEAVHQFKGKKVAACAAIGQPRRFFIMLKASGFTLSCTEAFPDHYDYKSSPFSDIEADFIFITAKDAVKCRKFDDPRLWVVETETQFSSTDWADPVLSLLANH